MIKNPSEQVRAAEAFALANPKVGRVELERRFPISGKQIRRIRRELMAKTLSVPPAGQPTPPKPSGGISRAELAEKWDADSKTRSLIRRGLKLLVSDNMMEDQTFRIDLCSGAPTHNWSRVAEEEEFKKNRFHLKNGNRIWATQADKAWALSHIQGSSE